jgi:hypothetical protein
MQRAMAQPMLAAALRGRYKYIALVGDSPVLGDVYKTLVKQCPKQVLLANHNQLINHKGYDHRNWSNVLFAINHDITVAPYKNHWLEYISKRNHLTNQSIGLVSYPEYIDLTDAQLSIFHEFMLNERQSLINGYYPVRYSAQSANQTDVKTVISAIHAAVLRD